MNNIVEGVTNFNPRVSFEEKVYDPKNEYYHSKTKKAFNCHMTDECRNKCNTETDFKYGIRSKECDECIKDCENNKFEELIKKRNIIREAYKEIENIEKTPTGTPEYYNDIHKIIFFLQSHHYNDKERLEKLFTILITI